ncbi:MAG TPA: hypothetical protein VJ349_02820 [Stellaceae bacterium]|nr:hypothetical protein [Stellaceae bacterium]
MLEGGDLGFMATAATERARLLRDCRLTRLRQIAVVVRFLA